MSETGKSTSTPSGGAAVRRLSPEVRGRVDAYLLRLDAALTQSGATPHQRRTVGSALRQRIVEKLAARGEAGAKQADVDAVLAELGKPESHVGDAASVPRAPVIPRMAPSSPAGAAPDETPELPLHTGPRRISMMALVGGLLSFLPFAAVVAWALTRISGMMVVVALSSMLATTVLGLLAIGRIQRSRGHLFGLSLALCDALVFPLLLLDGIIFWICWRIADTLMQQGSINQPIYQLIREIIPTVAVILADYFLAVQAWAAVQVGTARRR